MSVRVAGVVSRSGRSGGRRGSRSWTLWRRAFWRLARPEWSRGSFPQSSETFHSFRDVPDQVRFQSAGFGKKENPDIEGNIEGGGEAYEKHLPRMGFDELADGIKGDHMVAWLHTSMNAVDSAWWVLLSELCVNVSAGWLGAAFIVPATSKRPLKINLLLLTTDLLFAILFLVIGFQLRKIAGL